MNTFFPPLSRRNFLRGAACCLLFAQGLGVRQALADNTKIRWGLLVDTRLCGAECVACVDACVDEHALQSHGRANTDARWIRKVRLVDKSTGLVSHLPVMCQHCADAQCVRVCPTGASYRRADGLVLVNRHLCIGCRYCMMACPYKARGFVYEKVEKPVPHSPRGMGTVEGCTLCSHRIDAGRKPACVEACARGGRGAMLFGNLNDPADSIAKRVVAFNTTALRPELLTNPGVRYQGVNP
ncbi:MAG: 4Fe-4S dicluster domain-containing protein [Desulfovibrio sp.]|jgi:molybdopterin-containing oxidoreductase family iron-sulfur binding subunit|nr:4Fe-4S dicluster domain-containing protein [Desulfovibrio sp.]